MVAIWRVVGVAWLGATMLAMPAHADEARVALPEITKGKGDACVEPTPVMRRNHMKFLMHQRDDTVEQGIRSKRHSLKECVECHVGRDSQGDTLAVNAPGQFCYECHSYAAVKMDCFECHATTPDSGSASSQHSRAAEPDLLDGQAHRIDVSFMTQLLHRAAPRELP